jgi:hypothetical protein
MDRAESLVDPGPHKRSPLAQDLEQKAIIRRTLLELDWDRILSQSKTPGVLLSIGLNPSSFWLMVESLFFTGLQAPIPALFQSRLSQARTLSRPFQPPSPAPPSEEHPPPPAEDCHDAEQAFY